MNKIYLLIFMLNASLAFSQKEANIWYFGQNAGIDLNTNPPVALDEPTISTSSGSAVMSDTTGKLLFYSDALNIWNWAHDIMPNGNIIDGGFATQGVLIV